MLVAGNGGGDLVRRSRFLQRLPLRSRSVTPRSTGTIATSSSWSWSAQYRDKGLYDCIVPFSGGKDSVFQLWYVVRKLER